MSHDPYLLMNQQKKILTNNKENQDRNAN